MRMDCLVLCDLSGENSRKSQFHFYRFWQQCPLGFGLTFVTKEEEVAGAVNWQEHIVVRWIGDYTGNTVHRLWFHATMEEEDEVAHVRAAGAAESSLGMSAVAAAAAELRTNQHCPEHYDIDTDIGVAAVADDNCRQRNK